MDDFFILRIPLVLAWILLAALLWQSRRRRSRRGQRSSVPMEGNQCLVAENGDVSIGPCRIRKLIWLGAAGAVWSWGICLVVWFSLPKGALEPQIAWAWIKAAFAMGTALLAAAGILLPVSWMQPEIHISSAAGEVEWKKGFRTLRIPFESISHVGALFYSSVNLSVHRTYILRQAKPGAEIELALKDGGWIPLAKFSREKSDLPALEAAHLVADATGVRVKITKNN
jgi:hypothetical protein